MRQRHGQRRVHGKGPRFTEKQTAEVLELVKHVKTVEMKVTVPEGSYRTTARSLGLDPLDAQLRQVVFFDTPDLDLNKAGVVVRARRSQGGPDDTVIKLRPVVPQDVPAELRAKSEFGIEVDALPGGYVCSASYKGELSKNRVRGVILGERKISKLFSRGQTTSSLPTRQPASSSTTSRARAAERVEAQVRSEGLRAATRCRVVAVSRWIAHPRAVDEVHSIGDLPGRRREPGIPHRSRHRPRGEQSTKTATALNFFAAEVRSEQ